jgi:predicted ABC-type ATPase
MPNLYIIGGANGSGKTTAALQILPYFLEVFEYVNADEIAGGLSPPGIRSQPSRTINVRRTRNFGEC